MLPPIRWSIRVLPIAILLISAGVAFGSGATTTPDLFKIATKLISEPMEGTYNVDHPWVSVHEVLHVKDGGLWLYDTKAKTDSKLQKLSDEMFSGYGFLMIEASPRGNYVAWNRSSVNTVWETANLDGGNLKQWPAPLLNDVSWCADGAHWVRRDTSLKNDNVLRSLRFVVYQAADPVGKRVVYDVPNGLRGLAILATPTPTTVIACVPAKEDVGPTKEHHLPDGSVEFTWESAAIPQPVQKISAWDLSTGKRTGEWTIKLPGVAVEAAVSSDGKRVAWIVTPSQTSSLLNQASISGESLWVSNLDGRSLHEIGSFSSNLDGAHVISEVDWVPGNKAISFHYNYWLYEVPAL